MKIKRQTIVTSGEPARFELTHTISIVCKNLNIAIGAERVRRLLSPLPIIVDFDENSLFMLIHFYIYSDYSINDLTVFLMYVTLILSSLKTHLQQATFKTIVSKSELAPYKKQRRVQMCLYVGKG